jgi:hypothetical protein
VEIPEAPHHVMRDPEIAITSDVRFNLQAASPD